MSKLLRSIKRHRKELNGEKLSILDHLSEYYDDIMDGIKEKLHYYEIHAFISNLRIFIPMAWKWRSFDYSYTIDALVILTKENGRAMRRATHSYQAERRYRQCMRAAGQLERAYNWDMVVVDKSLDRLRASNHISLNPIPGKRTYSLDINYKISGKYYDDMLALIEKRRLAASTRAKIEAWAYIHKNCEFWWE